MKAAPETMPTTEPVAVQVAPAVFMFRGLPGEVEANNLGRLGNAGFIVGPEGVLAIDAGTSYLHGQALLKAIAQVTPLPVRMLVLTHTHQEFLFGAKAFQERGIAVHMQRRAAQLMAARCDNCLKTLNRVLGEDAMRGTALIKPDVLFDDSVELNSIGRPVKLLYHGHSSGPGDVAVFDVRSGVLFAGGLVDNQRIPDVQDSLLPGWRSALQALRTLPIKTIVPGHGPMAPPTAIDTQRRYLDQLEAKVLALLKAGAALSEVPDAAALPEFERWDQSEIVHRRNASVLFVRAERDQMFK
jgi:glyoxylase-like metal-dependent hydrolase (beta-lactamase superfamily II)